MSAHGRGNLLRRTAALALVLALAATGVLALACGEEEVETQDVVSTIPWEDGEETRYRLEDRDGEPKGTGVLRVEREGDSFRLTLRFSDNSNSDESEVLVDAGTLKPVSLRREIRSEGEMQTVEAEYMGDQVRIRAVTDGEERQSFLRIPEHSYDNDSSLLLWRSMPLAPDYTASYNSVITNQRQNRVVTVSVVGKEEVEVPAGVFEAWRVELRAGDISQVAWFSADERRLLLKYDNSRLVFLLEEMPSDG